MVMSLWPRFLATLYTSGSQAFQTTGQKQYLGKFVGPLRKVGPLRLSYPTLLLWVAVLNTNMVQIKYARPKILAGHLVGSRGPKMARGPQFGNHCCIRSAIEYGLPFRLRNERHYNFPPYHLYYLTDHAQCEWAINSIATKGRLAGSIKFRWVSSMFHRCSSVFH